MPSLSSDVIAIIVRHLLLNLFMAVRLLRLGIVAVARYHGPRQAVAGALTGIAALWR